MLKTCPSCGKVFTCMNPLGNCWCNSYDISRENLNFLAQKYDNCLCPDCLEKYST